MRKGGVIVYPADSGYALGFGQSEDKGAMGAFAASVICRTATASYHALMCRDLSELSTYSTSTTWHFV
ncbi:hypothetical protein KCP73_26605 [Salmonella enterica subsp. enterica]|nr:hypothetical protein KCP73_26605 [Salmonella enterica subsp. enterica]